MSLLGPKSRDDPDHHGVHIETERGASVLACERRSNRNAVRYDGELSLRKPRGGERGRDLVGDARDLAGSRSDPKPVAREPASRDGSVVSLDMRDQWASGKTGEKRAPHAASPLMRVDDGGRPNDAQRACQLPRGEAPPPFENRDPHTALAHELFQWPRRAGNDQVRDVALRVQPTGGLDGHPLRSSGRKAVDQNGDAFRAAPRPLPYKASSTGTLAEAHTRAGMGRVAERQPMPPSLVVPSARMRRGRACRSLRDRQSRSAGRMPGPPCRSPGCRPEGGSPTRPDSTKSGFWPVMFGPSWKRMRSVDPCSSGNRCRRCRRRGCCGRGWWT